jgi:hypothetical protein
MLSHEQFLDWIVRPALKSMGLYSRDMEALVMASIARAELFVHQHGVFDMDAYTHDMLWQATLSEEPALARNILNACHFLQRPQAEEMLGNLRYATMMCAVYYHKIKQPYPSFDDKAAVHDFVKTYHWAQNKTEKDVPKKSKHKEAV